MWHICVGQRINFRNWFFPSTVGSGKGIRVARLARQQLLSLSHLTGPKNSHSSDHLLDHLVGYTGAEIMATSGPHLDQTASFYAPLSSV